MDCTECPIASPVNEPWAYYSPKKATHTLKYEIGLHMKEDIIVWISASYKGSVHDLTIAKDGLCKNMKPGEKALGDKGYVGHKNFLAPFKSPKTPEQKQFNKSHYKVRARIEMLNRRFKTWGCLKVAWRHSLEYHSLVFKLIGYIIQYDLKVRPLIK